MRLVNGYGPTEATITATLCELSGGFATHRQAGEVPIGRPLAHVQAWVLDDRLEPVPIGVAGELYLGGDSIARGYLSSPDLTAEKFIPNPHGDPGTRLYRTGDRVQCLRNGQFVFLGRIDNQVKIRGFRIECGEIESVLNTHTAVREAVVVARENGLDEKQLVAYIVPASQAENAHHRVARSFEKQTAGVYGAFGICDDGKVANDSQWQSRPWGVAVSGA